MKITHHLWALALMVFLWGCETNETIENAALSFTAADSTGRKSVVPTRYHFIRMDIESRVAYNQIATAIKDLARTNNGGVLTEGKPIDCLERKCEDLTFVLSFFSEADEILFSEQFTSLDIIADSSISNLSYSTAVPFSRPEVFAQGIDDAYYFVGNGNFLDLPRYVTEYGPNAIALIAQNGGALISADFRTPECILGDCNFFNVLIQFPSLRSAQRWYNSEAYQQIIPIRQEVTEGGGLLLAAKN